MVLSERALTGAYEADKYLNKKYNMEERIGSPLEPKSGGAQCLVAS